MNSSAPVARATHHVVGDQLFVALMQASRRSTRVLQQRLRAGTDTAAERESTPPPE